MQRFALLCEMSRLIDRGRDLLVRSAGSAAGVLSLVYTAGPNSVSPGTVVDLTSSAWVGRTVFKSNLEGAVSLQFGDRDYLIPAEALGFEPARGDRLTETLAGESKMYEIVSPDTGEPAWRWSEAQETIYRVHCKKET
jgi:hypothetical protein